jgi:lipopolysaccharide transport system permease protein
MRLRLRCPFPQLQFWPQPQLRLNMDFDSKKSHTIIYEPNQRLKIGWIRTWIILVRNIIQSWELIYQLFRRDFLMSYKKSFIGAGWIFISPIFGVVSWVFYKSTGVLQPGDVGIPYPAYVLLSTSIYGLFGGFFAAASGTLTAGTGFITQVNYHHDALLIKQAMLQLANFAVVFFINIIVLFSFRVVPSLYIFFLPLLILPIFFIGSAIGLFACIIEVVASDINKVITFLIGLLLFITPVIYSSKVQNPLLQHLIKWNPLTYLIGGTRDVIIYGKMEHINTYFICSGASFLCFLFAWRIFYITEQRIIEKMI